MARMSLKGGAVAKGRRISLTTKCVAGMAMALSVSACATVPAGAALHTAEAVPMSHYSGTWREIARHPMMLTNGCVAGYTTYTPGAKRGSISIEDGCHDKTPNGKLKTIHADGVLLDAGGANAKLKASYPFFITYNYWVLYEAPDHGWFISATPDMKNLWIYTRDVPSADAFKTMVAKAQALGYDTSQLEFPAP